MVDKHNKKKAHQLGMPFGTANGRLRKTILFHLLCKLGDNQCHRCGEIIETEETLSIEHKEPWLDIDPALFWDIENIAFSHLTCNISAARKPNKINCPAGQGWCWKCQTFKDLLHFPGSKKHKSSTSCTVCGSEQKADWRKKTNQH